MAGIEDCDGCKAGLELRKGMHLKTCESCFRGRALKSTIPEFRFEACEVCAGAGQYPHSICTLRSLTTGEFP